MHPTWIALALAAPIAASGDVSTPLDEGDRPAALAQESARGGALREASAPISVTDRAAREALNAGLRFLAQRHAETTNGSFPTNEAKNRAPVGITSLATLAFLAAGNTPTRGPYARNVSRAVDYLLDRVDLSPESERFGYISAGDDLSRTHGHGYATLVLAEAYGMSPERSGRIARALEAAVRRIETSQSEQGGWEYEPVPVPTPEGSVTICYVQALRAARNSGVRVDVGVVRRAEDYVKRLQKDDGTFRYKMGDEKATVALTAAALTTLNMAGRYDDSVIRSGIDAIWSGLTLQNEGEGRIEWPFYQRLYIAQAFWQLSNTDDFDRWFVEERDRLLRTQKSDGSWSDHQYGDCYATAVNCLVLALPSGLLPIFQR